jgi:nucleotide-binding universal stress UspA family protein
MIELTHVLVATDFGESADTALAYGRALARNFDATLHVLNVVEDVFARGLEAEPLKMWSEVQRDAEETAANQLAARVRTDRSRRFRERAVIRVSAKPADAIVAYARESGIDLIVMGTHGPDAVAGVALGSVAERVVHTAPCPVLTVKHPEHDFVGSEHAAAATNES